VRHPCVFAARLHLPQSIRSGSGCRCAGLQNRECRGSCLSSSSSDEGQRGSAVPCGCLVVWLRRATAAPAPSHLQSGSNAPSHRSGVATACAIGGARHHPWLNQSATAIRHKSRSIIWKPVTACRRHHEANLPALAACGLAPRSCRASLPQAQCRWLVRTPARTLPGCVPARPWAGPTGPCGCSKQLKSQPLAGNPSGNGLMTRPLNRFDFNTESVAATSTANGYPLAHGQPGTGRSFRLRLRQVGEELQAAGDEPAWRPKRSLVAWARPTRLETRWLVPITAGPLGSSGRRVLPRADPQPSCTHQSRTPMASDRRRSRPATRSGSS